MVRQQCGASGRGSQPHSRNQDDRGLLQVVGHLPQFARNAFSGLVDYLPRAPEHDKFHRCIESIRNRDNLSMTEALSWEASPVGIEEPIPADQA